MLSHILFYLVTTISIMQCQKQSNSNPTRPNIVLMIADDMGIGDVGVFGNNSLATPNIDYIAKQGVKLTQHLTAASLCTPSRAAMLTGRYPIRSGMTSHARNRVFLFVASSAGLPVNETTFAHVLKEQNYATALIGKWHLGWHQSNPLNHGFDHFYGLPLTNLKDFGDDNASVILSYFPKLYLVLSTVSVTGLTIAILLYFKNYSKSAIFLAILFIGIPGGIFFFQRNIKTMNSILMRGNQVVEQPVQLKGITDRLVNEAERFISQQVEQNKQFLVVLNFVKVHTAHYPSDEFYKKSKFGKYGDCVMEMDYGVGRMLDILEKRNLKSNTLVYFSSDNGGHLEERSLDKLEQEGGYNGIYRGGKGHGAMEGGIRVPTVAMWPGVIPASSVISSATSQMDIFATIHDALKISLPSDRIIDGKSILPLLKGSTQSKSPHKFLFHYCGAYLHGVRYIEDEDHVWKFYFYTPNYKVGEDKCDFVCMCYGEEVVKHDPPLLYNIAIDQSEKHSIDIHSNPKYEKLNQIVMKAVKEHESSIKPVPSQFSLKNSIWKPWLQPCCGFPFCRCKE